jgi:hypothetical protein
MRSNIRANNEADFKFEASGKDENKSAIGLSDRAAFVPAAIAANPFLTNSAFQHPDTTHSKHR